MTDNTAIKNNTTTDDTGNNDTINDNTNNKSIWSKFKYLIIWALIIIILYGAFWGAVFYLESDWTIRGQFGDMFGAINALFSGIALAGIIFAIYLQSQELAAQREELRLTREEMKLSRDELRGQKEVMSSQIELNKIQQWENMLFKLFELFRNIYEQFIYGSVSGNRAFKNIEDNLKNNIKSFNEYKNGTSRQQLENKRAVEEQIHEARDLLNHYINMVTNILEYISSLESTTTQSIYFNTFKSLLSQTEVNILFMYRDHIIDEIKFQKIMDETQFLDLFTT